MNKLFAPDYPRDDNSLIRFPSDVQYRKELFPLLDLSAHPAKANLYMIQAIVEYTSEIGECILDPFTGTGSIMVAALMGRDVLCMELEDGYCGIIEQGVKSLESIAPGIDSAITLIPGDCSNLLPILGVANHICFSPPYAGALKKKTMDKFTMDTLGTGVLDYSKNPMNIGNLSDFLYKERMQAVYRKCYESLPTGGTISIIIKDHIVQGERVNLSKRAMNDCVKAGFELDIWEQWYPPGTAYTGIRRARGEEVVDEESIIILRRP